MQHHQFRARALSEARRYGDDDLVFLRELAQNSRDAGARRIVVKTRFDADGDWVIFDDDGCGMSFEHARAYLFKLYASSKESDLDAAGKFGVGFWSVLRWEPDLIVVESRTRREGWAVTLDAALTDVHSIPATMDRPGTRVALRRPHRAASPAALAREIETGLRRFCRYLRRAGKGFNELPVTCNGARINEPFAIDGPFSLAFQSREVEGVVGLGLEPRVELYARGLLVTTASVLEEIEPGATVLPRNKRVAGMAPVILINSNDLDVVLSRQAPVRGRALKRLVRVARARLHRLVGRLVDGACPSSWWERAAGRLDDLWSLPASRLASIAAAVIVLALAGVTVGAFVKIQESVDEPSSPPVWTGRATDLVSRLPAGVVPASPPIEAERLESRPSQLPYANLSGYAGATVDVPDAQVVPWGLTYEGPKDDVLFRVLTLDRYDPEVGWLRRESTELVDYPGFRCRRDCVTVRLQVLAPADPLVVPLPTGMRLERTSLRFSGAFVETVYENEHGEALVVLHAGRAGLLEYVAGPGRPGKRPAVDAPKVTMPDWIERRLASIATRPFRKRVRLVTGFVRHEIAYDVSPEAAHAFATEPGDWLTRVMRLRAGDCDVKNGVNVLLLRRLGIPARMAVGIAARRGRARPNLHAWTEYYIKGKGWRAIDATGVSRPRRRPAVASVAAQAVASHLQDPPAPGAALERETLAPGRAAVPPSSPVVEMPPAVAVLDDRLPPVWVGWGVVVLLGLFGLVGLWRFAGAQVRERVVSVGDAIEQQRVLATMLHDALAHPDAWRSVASLWRRRVLPTLRGRKMSVADALRRAINGRLFVSTRRSELACLAAARRTPVLDGGDPVFGRVVSALGRTVDLDALGALRPPAAGGDDVTGYRLEGVLDPVNRVLRDVTGGVECRVCPALEGSPIRDVDLTAIRLPRRAPWPRRFVAINPHDPEVRRRARLLAQDPGRGVFVWIDWLLDRSQLLSRDATRLRERAASDLLEVVA